MSPIYKVRVQPRLPDGGPFTNAQLLAVKIQLDKLKPKPSLVVGAETMDFLNVNFATWDQAVTSSLTSMHGALDAAGIAHRECAGWVI
jgi:hypothetical protein